MAEIAATVTVAIIGTIKLWGSKFIEGKVAYQFARQLADHQAQLKKEEEKFKNELGLITEGAKFNYSRRLADFKLFAAKWHSVYPELHRHYRAAFDAFHEYHKRNHHDDHHVDLAEEREGDGGGAAAARPADDIVDALSYPQLLRFTR